jgi:Zn-dependent protease
MVNMIIDIIFINIYLAVFNIIPIPPLDGSQFLAGLLRRSDLVYSLQRYGFVLLILLILPIFGGNSIIGIVLGPISVAIFTIFSAISQVIAHLIGF